MENKDIGERLRSWAKERYGSPRALALKMGKTEQALQPYLKGTSKPGAKLQAELRELGCDIEWLMTGKAASRAWYEKVNPVNMPPARGVENLPPEQLSPMMLSPAQAGEPQYAYSDIKAFMPVGKQYHEKSYHIQARGESMKGAGIQEGDWLLVDEEREAVNGNIVLARVGDRLTIKRLKKNGDCWLLHPDNPEYEPIACDGDVDIVAVVIKKEVMFV